MRQPKTPSIPSYSTLFSVDLVRLTLNNAVRLLSARLDDAQGGYLCIVNVHTLTESQANPALKSAYQEALFNFADGVPLVWYSKIKDKNPLPERVCGPDLSQRLMEERRDLTYGFIGGLPGQAEAISKKFGIRSIAYCPPHRPFTPESAREDWQEFLRVCEKSHGGTVPSMVWVGLGAPKQELWMREVSPLSPNTLFCGIGAAFDFHSGRIDRAPRWMQKSGLEWAHRLSQDPRRLWKRYLRTNSKFLGMALRDFFR